MHLEHEAGLQAACRQLVVDANHGELHDIRRGALHGRIDGHPLGGLPHHGGLGAQVGEVAPAAEERQHVPGVGGRERRLLDILAHLREAVEVTGDVGAGLLQGDSHGPGQAGLRDAVGDAEVHGLGETAHLRRGLFRGYTEDLQRGRPVEVLILAEDLDQALVPGDVGEDAQFDLRVVGGDQHVAGRRDEGAADLRAQLAADRDVLQIGIAAAQAGPSR